MSHRSELRIFDRVANGALVGVERLLASLTAAVPEATSWVWTVRPGAWGHGRFVCSIDDSLVAGTRTTATTGDLLKHLEKDDEYFGHVVLEAHESDVVVAVIDSSFLQLIGDAALLHRCAGDFEQAEVVEGNSRPHAP